MAEQQGDETSRVPVAAYTPVSQNEEDNPPPAYEDAAVPSTSQGNAESQPSVVMFETTKLPSYELATNLPTYDDFKEEKDAEVRQERLEMFLGSSNDNNGPYIDGLAVGTDCLFIVAFTMAFFFSWVGFFVGYCIMMCHAGRCGAVSGFGLSIVNWLLYVKYQYADSNDQWDMHTPSTERLVLWWFLFVAALLLTIKGLTDWARVRKVAQQSPDQRENRRYMFLY